MNVDAMAADMSRPDEFFKDMSDMPVPPNHYQTNGSYPVRSSINRTLNRLSVAPDYGVAVKGSFFVKAHQISKIRN